MRANRRYKPVIRKRKPVPPPIVTLTPPAPGTLNCTVGNALVNLSWSPVLTATSYNIKRSTTTGTEVNVHTGITTTSYVDTGRTNGTQYFYKVTAVNAAGVSAPSPECNATPAAPALSLSGLAVGGTWPSVVAQGILEIGYAFTDGYDYVSSNIGSNNYGGAAHADMTSLTNFVNAVCDSGIAGCNMLLNTDPKPNDTFVLALNSGVTWNTATRAPDTTDSWVEDLWVDSLTTINTACTAKGKSAATLFKIVGQNEVGKGGNKGPKNLQGTYDAPYDTQKFGAIEPAWITKYLRIVNNVAGRTSNFFGMAFCPINFEAAETDGDFDGVLDATQEVNSIVGADAVSLYSIAGVTYFVSCDPYGKKPVSPYNGATYTTTSFIPKVQREIDRFAANPILAGLPIEIREYGLSTGNQASDGTDVNTTRNDMLHALRTLTTVRASCIFCATGNAPFAIMNTDGTFINGVTVEP